MRPLKYLSTFFLAIAFASILGCAGTAMRENTGGHVSDSWITANVTAALVEDAAFKATEVNVETYNGTVKLSGVVSSEAARSKAAQVARGIQGVTGIKNDILIK